MSIIKIAVIDSDLISKGNQRFPNLACMKLSAYHKALNHDVELKTDYMNLSEYDKVLISKVFTKSEIPAKVLELPNVTYGGTGFFYDKAIFLPSKIEHLKPDYHLYDDFICDRLEKGLISKSQAKYYTDFSIGFTTRFCFRGCQFCVNQNHKETVRWSALAEFVDNDRKKIAMLDDNVLAYENHMQIFDELNQTGKRFRYRQGLDIRLINEENAQMLAKSRIDGDTMFSFDRLKDKEIVELRLRTYRKHNHKDTKFCVLCAYDPSNRYDDDFWINDIISIFERIKILSKFSCLPYIMRYEKYKDSPYYGTYVNLASWCNQPSFFKKLSYEEYCDLENRRKGNKTSTMRYFNDFRDKQRSIADKYYKTSFNI